MNFIQKHRKNKFIQKIYNLTPKFVHVIIFSIFGIIKYTEYIFLKNTYLKKLIKYENLSRNEMNYLKEKKLKKIINHAYKRTNYYKKVLDRINLDPQNFKLEDLKKLPILTKKIVAENYNDLIASNAKEFKPVKQSSGGTTGTTLNFLMDKNNYYYKESELLLFWRRYGYYPRKDKAVMFRAGVLFPNHKRNLNKPWIIDYGRKLLYLSSYYSSQDNYLKYYNKLKSWQPEYMHVLPSAGYLFAKYLNDNNLKLNLKLVFSASEMLYESHKIEMEKAFNCSVVDHYGHGEPGIYAAGTCEFGNYHICESNTIVEMGEDSSIIETCLNNFSMPFIRYEVGDKISSYIEEECKCNLKSSYIKGVDGRESEIIYTKDGRKISTIGFDQIFRNKNVVLGQLIQYKKGEIDLKIIPSEKFNESDKKNIFADLIDRVGKKTVINMEIVNNIPRAKSGKYNLVISKIK